MLLLDSSVILEEEKSLTSRSQKVEAYIRLDRILWVFLSDC